MAESKHLGVGELNIYCNLAERGTLGCIFRCKGVLPKRILKSFNRLLLRLHETRIREVERGVFTPLVLSTTGGMEREATTFYKRLADMIAQKRQHPYPAVMGWLRCRLSFASLRASIMCIRDSRSSFHRPVYGSDITLATSEGRVPSV